MKKVKDFTIIIPTHNRHGYLKRVIEYYSKITETVIIADSSEKRYDGKLPGKFKYLYLKGINFTGKLNIALSNVETEYMVFCADDDFIIINGVSQCIKFLKLNKDYAAVTGHFMIFINKNKKIKFIPNYLEGIGKDVADDSFEKRLVKHFAAYEQLFYAVHRTEIMKSLFKQSESRIFQMHLIEILISFFSLIHGKMKILNIPFGVREVIENSAGQSVEYAEETLNNPEKRKEAAYFKQIIVSEISKNAGLNKKDALKIYISAYNAYLTFRSIDFRSHKKMKIKNYIYYYLNSILITRYLIKLNQLIKAQLKRKNTSVPNLNESCADNKKLDIDKRYAFLDKKTNTELKKIEKLVIKHNI